MRAAITGNPFSPGNMPPAHIQGIAARSKHRIRARAHIVVLDGGEYRTWCTAAAALAETALGDPCPKCLALLREYHDEYDGPAERCTCGIEEHPEYGRCRKPAADCPIHEGR
jgi:hypothetical protein